MILINSYWSKSPNPQNRLLFLHGMGGTGTLWRPVAASLEDEFEILAPDQRGHGGSQVPFVSGGRNEPTYTPLTYGQDVVDTMEEKKFHPAILIGHSMGVRTACAVGHLRPDWVQGMVLIDLGFSGAAGGGLGDTLGDFLKILPMEFASRAEAREFMTENCPDPAIAQYLMAVSVQTDAIRFPFDKAALIQTIHAARDSSVRTWILDLAKKGMPILVLRGAQSLVWSKSEYEMEKKTLSPYPSVEFREIEGTGHGLPFEKRKDFVELLKKWISTTI